MNDFFLFFLITVRMSILLQTELCQKWFAYKVYYCAIDIVSYSATLPILINLFNELNVVILIHICYYRHLFDIIVAVGVFFSIHWMTGAFRNKPS